MSLASTKVSAILLAGGQGLRMGASTPKQYIPLQGKPIALYSLEMLLCCLQIDQIIVVCAPHYHSLFKRVGEEITFATPGRRRQDSVYSALQHVSKECELVLIHDAARPLIEPGDIGKVIRAGQKYGAAALASPITSTIKMADTQAIVSKTLDRKMLFAIHTPQVLTKEILIKGFAKALENDLTVTDDVSLAELIQRPVKLVMGSPYNIKITTPEDLDIAATFLAKTREERSFAQV